MKPFAITIRREPYSTSHPTPWIGESHLMAQAEIVCDIYNLQIDPNDVLAVLLIDPVAGTTTDVTSEVADQVMELYEAADDFPTTSTRGFLYLFATDHEWLLAKEHENWK
jgi:hypothetical protein